jgi:hypothetical protein
MIICVPKFITSAEDPFEVNRQRDDVIYQRFIMFVGAMIRRKQTSVRHEDVSKTFHATFTSPFWISVDSNTITVAHCRSAITTKN